MLLSQQSFLYVLLYALCIGLYMLQSLSPGGQVDRTLYFLSSATVRSAIKAIIIHLQSLLLVSVSEIVRNTVKITYTWKTHLFYCIIIAAIITAPSLSRMQQIQPALSQSCMKIITFFVPSRKCVIALWLKQDY